MDNGSIPNPDYCSPAAEAKDAPPVASGLDSTPSSWFEFGAQLCHEGHISMDRMYAAFEAVRKGVDRG